MAVPQLTRWEEMWLLGKLPPIQCDRDPKQCDGVWEVRSEWVGKFCHDFDNEQKRIAYARPCAETLQARSEDAKAHVKVSEAIEDWESL